MTESSTSKTPPGVPIGRRPAAVPATAWVHREHAGGTAVEPAIDVTPALRGRIKVTEFGRCITAANMLRELLEREFAQGKS